MISDTALCMPLGGDAVFLIVLDLLLPPPVGLIQRTTHGARHIVGIKNCRAVDVARRASTV